MQNKPNFQKAQISVSIFSKMAYKNFIPLAGQKNKPNSNPIKPNLRKAKMNVNSLITKDYRKNDDFAVRINKPNSNPVLSAVDWTNFKPPGNEPQKLKRKRGPQELFCLSGLPERLTF